MHSRSVQRARRRHSSLVSFLKPVWSGATALADRYSLASSSSINDKRGSVQIMDSTAEFALTQSKLAADASTGAPQINAAVYNNRAGRLVINV